MTAGGIGAAAMPGVDGRVLVAAMKSFKNSRLQTAAAAACPEVNAFPRKHLSLYTYRISVVYAQHTDNLSFQKLLFLYQPAVLQQHACMHVPSLLLAQLQQLCC